MYKRILVALENGPADRSLVPHIAHLASLLNSELLLIHVADGWVARHYHDLKLAESDEMRADREYLQQHATALGGKGLKVRIHLALGNPPTEILKAAEQEQCDLIGGPARRRVLEELERARGELADLVVAGEKS